MPQRNVNLTPHFDKFIDTTIASGRYSNASEIVREGLRLLEQHEKEDRAKLDWLRAAAKEGFGAIKRGDYTALDSDAEIAKFMKGIREEISLGATEDRGE